MSVSQSGMHCEISGKHKELIRAELQKWDISNERVQQTYKLAGKFL